MTAVLIARVHAFGGADAVARLLRLAGSERSPEYLADITNWIAYDEAVALWTAGALVTHHPQFARAVGEDTARRLSGSQVSAALRSLGSPEKVYRAIATSAGEFSTVTKLSIIDAGPGFADIVATAADGYRRSPEHCAWTSGLLTCGPVLFGLAAARVEHVECQAVGAPRCVYQIRWETERESADGSPEQIAALQHQLDAMRERLHSVFAAASDLIAADDLDDVLARITARAALEVRAVRYLLAVKVGPRASCIATTRGSRTRASPSTSTSSCTAWPRLIRTRGWSYRSVRTGAITAGWSRSAAPARASWHRSASCSRCTRTTPRPRSTARRR